MDAEPKQAEAPRAWPELLDDVRKNLRAGLDEQDRLPPDQRDPDADDRYYLASALLDVIERTQGRIPHIIGEPPPSSVASAVAVAAEFFVVRLLHVMDRRYEPKAKRPEHDFDMPHTFRPGHAVECPPGCPARLQAPTLERLHAALVAEGIPLVDSLSEAFRSPGRARVELPSGRMFDRYGREVPRTEAPQASEGWPWERVEEAVGIVDKPEQSTLEVVAALLGVDPDDAHLDERVLEAIGRLQGELAAAKDRVTSTSGLTEWQRLAADTGVDLGDSQAFTRIANAVNRMAWHNARWAAAGGRIQAALGAPTTSHPDNLADRVETLAASERQLREAGSHREQLRQHYWQVLRDAFDNYLDRLPDEAIRYVVGEYDIDLGIMRDRVGYTLDNPPEWDGQVR